MLKSVGNRKGQKVTSLFFCVPKKQNDIESGFHFLCEIERCEGDYVVASQVANGLSWVKVGTLLCRLEHYTSRATETAATLITDIAGDSLQDVATYAEGIYESDAFVGWKAPERDLQVVPFVNPGFLNSFKGKQPSLTKEQLEQQLAYTEMMVTKSKVYTASIAEEASADFEAHAAAAAEAREEVQLGDVVGVECSVCHHRFSSAAVCKAHA
jgi:hypothetical protein